MPDDQQKGNKSMSMTSHFQELDAPLANSMWSWGAVREADKTVFLRVWQAGTKKYPELENKYYTWVIDADGSDQSLGANERRKHLQLIEQGYTVYMIMCQEWDDDESRPKQGSVKDFNDDELFLGGRLVKYRGNILLEHAKRVPFRDGRLKS